MSQLDHFLMAHRIVEMTRTLHSKKAWTTLTATHQEAAHLWFALVILYHRLRWFRGKASQP
ncbi:MAG: hypothetical protein RMJ98_12815 [Myxococcales bacterium]|nr:hypothetical protein [Myxococcales bacterium]